MSNERELPKNLVLREGIYYVRAKFRSKAVWRTTGYGEGALKSAIARRDEIMVQLRKGIDEDADKPVEVPTFREWVATYKATFSPDKRAPWRDEQILATLPKDWLPLKLDEFTPSKVKQHLNTRGRVVAGSTLNRERGTIQAVFERAIEEGLIDKNPFRYIEREAEGPRIRVLLPSGELKLRAVLSPIYGRWLTFMLGTGLRLAEAQAITEAEVDSVRELIRVPDYAAKFGKAREVPMPPDVWQTITLNLAECNGKLWHCNQQRYRDVLQESCLRAKIGPGDIYTNKTEPPKHVSPHDLRHTFATRYLQAGGDIFKLSGILGHASVKMSQDFYSHLQSQDLVDASREVWAKQGRVGEEGVA